MKEELRRLRGTTIRTAIGDVTLREFYRQDDSEHDQIYFKTSGVEAIAKVYELEDPASQQRFGNEMQQYNRKPVSIIYDKVYCEEVQVKKVAYGLILFLKLDRESSIVECRYSITPNDQIRLAVALTQMLHQLKDAGKIYCNIRPQNIFKLRDKFVIINAQFLTPQGARSDMGSFLLESIENSWKYWPVSVIDPYSREKFDYTIDMYAAGCVLYECVTGTYPFDSKLSASTGQYTPVHKHHLLSSIIDAFLGNAQRRKSVNLKEVIAKLKSNKQVSFAQINFAEVPDQKNIRKGSGNGIFDNISNVFSKIMYDSEGWFLSYVEDDEKAPQEKYLDSILTKMYKKQQKADKLSGIIQKFITNNQSKTNSIYKVLILIGQAIRKGPEVALNILISNISLIKSKCNITGQVESFCNFLLKKVDTNEKLKRLLAGNFYLSDISKFKTLTIADLQIMLSYLQFCIAYIGNRQNFTKSQLSATALNLICDQVYDLVSMIIISVISIRKDNQLQLRADNTKELQPIEKSLNVCLRKISDLSNFVSQHALYSLQAQYIAYQQEILLKNNPYYSTLEYFYENNRTYKGLAIPKDYSQVFHKQEKKSMPLPTKQNKNEQGKAGKDYFRQELNSDEDDDFQKGQKPIQNSSKGYFQNFLDVKSEPKNTLTKSIQTKTSQNLKKSMDSTFFNDLGQPKNSQDGSRSTKNQGTISFQQFGKIHKAKSPDSNSPKKIYGQFFEFTNVKKQSHFKPPLPPKNLKLEKNKNEMTRSFVEFQQIFDQNKKQVKKQQSSQFFDFNQLLRQNSNKASSIPANQAANLPVNSPTSQTTNQPGVIPNNPTNGKTAQNKVQQFNAFLDYSQLTQSNLVNFPPPPTLPNLVLQIVNPLVTKILQGLKLKPLKDLIMANNKIVIDFSQLKIVKAIGSGSAGEVFYGKYRDQDVAIKKVKARQNPNALKQFQRELVTYIKIQTSPNLVSLVGLSQSNGDFYLITQFCSAGSLFDLLHKKKLEVVLSWKQRLQFAIEIAQGMEYLHSMKPIIIHRDLKSLNVFVNRKENSYKMKVADFGLSRSPEADMMTTQLGTIHWMAPELLEGKQYSYKVDVYSYGILLWEILSRTTPYSNLHNPMAILKYVVMDKQRPNMDSIPRQCPPQLVAVMQKCWAHEPGDRPPFAQVLKMLRQINL